MHFKNTIKRTRDILYDSFGPHKIPSSKPKLWILMYHRVLPKNDPRLKYEESGMFVTPETFELHMQYIKKQFKIIHLSEWIEKKNKGEDLPDKACAITFDDGWHDNFEYAVPILNKLEIPACIFAVAEKAGTNQQFWPNAIAQIFQKHRTNRSQLENTLAWIPNIEHVTQNPQHADALSRIIHECKNLPDIVIYEHLSKFEYKNCLESDKPDLMNWEQLRSLSQNPLFEIGSHTSHHYRLNHMLDSKLIKSEIIDSKKILEEQLQTEVPLFCYPNGDYTEEAAQLVAKEYAGAVTTQRGINNLTSQAHTLRRIGVHEDISRTQRAFSARLSGWI